MVHLKFSVLAKIVFSDRSLLVQQVMSIFANFYSSMQFIFMSSHISLIKKQTCGEKIQNAKRKL